jgi:TPR repeat protein
LNDPGFADRPSEFGICLLPDLGDPPDLISAAEYFKLTDGHGHAGGQFNSGVCLSEVRDVPIDWVSAAKYFKVAADQNHSDGQFCYGVCLSFERARRFP